MGQGDDSNTDRETLDDITRSRVRKSFIFYATELLLSLGEQLAVSGMVNDGQPRISLQDFCSRLIGRYAENVLYNGDFLSFLLEMNREKEPGSHTRTIAFDSGELKLDDDELKTIEEVFMKASVSLHSDGSGVGRVTVQSFPEEDVELVPGLKITNMNFTGVVK